MDTFAQRPLLATADVEQPCRNVAYWQIVLKKSFWSDEENFSGLLMRFARGDMRDHIVSHKNDDGASYKCYRALQWRSR
jgi:hypothetical protein